MRFIKYSLFTLLAAASLVGCKESLDDIKPTTAIPASEAIVDSISVERAVLGVYSGLQSNNHYGQIYLWYSDLYTDNIRFAGTFTTDREVANKVINPSNLQIANTWNTIFNTIARANYVIDGVEGVALSATKKSQIIAEARFLRGLCYYDLVTVFGGVPKIDYATKLVSDSKNLPRMTQAETYQFIISDLLFAETNLPSAGARSRARKVAATGLLARVYLQNGQYNEAATKASAVIATPGVSLLTYAAAVGDGTNAESLLTLNFNANDQSNLANSSNPGTAGQKFYATTNLNAAYPANDLRRPVNLLTQGSNIRIVKYFINQGTDDKDFQVIRVAEMYLIRAEANARLGIGTAPASVQTISDINTIRNRAGIGVTTAVTNDQALAEIFVQRRLEFPFEGHRFNDYKRYGGFFTGANAFRNLWPIPLQQLEINKALVQNPGYL